MPKYTLSLFFSEQIFELAFCRNLCYMKSIALNQQALFLTQFSTGGKPFRYLNPSHGFARPEMMVVGIMNYLRNKTFIRYRFDFDIGYLVKSPCRDCEERDLFPNCLDECSIIDRIHEVLSECVTSSKG